MKQKANPVFDSIAQCSAVTHIPISELRRAKRGGSPGFRSHRVDAYEVLKWIFGAGRKKTDRHITDVPAAKERDLIESALARKQKRMERDGQLVPKEFVDKALRDVLFPLREMLREMPFTLGAMIQPTDPNPIIKLIISYVEGQRQILYPPPLLPETKQNKPGEDSPTNER
jgi:hypothetical protein